MSDTLGRYELIAEIGRGGMADVKLALQRGPAGFEKLVVLKLVHEELASEKPIVDMLLDEAKLAAQIKHPNVVDVYELGEADGRYFIAMEYLEGEPLLSILDVGAADPKRRLDPLSIARILADTAEGLDAAHTLKGRDGKPLDLVHHDISLGNIFVLYSGQVKLLDFGVAKAARSAAAKKQSKQEIKVFGKLAYMAPEKLDERPGDRRSDIWSLGCVLWEALANKRLFKGVNDIELIREVRYVNVPAPSTVNPDVPAELDAIALRALQRDPFRRYQTAKEMAIALDEVLTAKAYPSKNYKIATYMMKTFADHIAARERLLRDVAGPHRPSAEVIEAAFGESRESRESLPSLDHLLDPANQVVLPEDSTGAELAVAVPTPTATPSAVVTAVDNPFDEPEAVETVYDVVPANAEASRALRYEADPSWIHSKHGQALRELQRKAQAQRENPDAARRRKRIPFLVGGAALAITMLVVIVKACGDDDGAKPAAVASSAGDPPPPDGAPAVAADPADAAMPDGGAVAAPVDAAAPAVDEAQIEMPPEDVSPPPDETASDETGSAETGPAETGSAETGSADTRPDAGDKKPRPRPTKSAQQLYAEGLAAWKKKDLKTAYARWTEGRRASSRYPNNWYGLGLVHEKAGRKAAARTAYERYLKLAPNAPNGAKLRDHIKRNLL